MFMRQDQKISDMMLKVNDIIFKVCLVVCTFVRKLYMCLKRLTLFNSVYARHMYDVHYRNIPTYVSKVTEKNNVKG